MSGSQPATVGELHPLHRKALRHPLILDGLSPTSRLRRFVETGSTGHRCASIENLCLHVLSSFQRTGLARHRHRARRAKSELAPTKRQRREVGRALPQVFLRWGNLTILLALSCSCQPLSASFSSFQASQDRSSGTKRAEERLGGCASQKDCWRIRQSAGSRSVHQIYAAAPGLSTRLF